MFCQKCGSRLPDDAKFCTACGAGTESNKAHETVSNATGNVPPPPPPQSYNQASYGPQQTYGYQQTPYQQMPYAPYGAPVMMPRRRITAANWVVFLGAVMALVAFFVPFLNFMGSSVTLMDSLFKNFSIETLPFAAFLLSGLLGLIFAFTKPGLAFICFILSAGACVYIFVSIMNQLLPLIKSLSFDLILGFLGVGLYLTAASILFFLVGSIMGMARR